MAEEQPPFEAEDPLFLEAAESYIKQHKLTKFLEEQSKLPIEDRKTEIMKRSEVEEGLAQDELPIEDKKTVILEPAKLEQRLDGPKTKRTVKLERPYDHRFLRFRIPNFFARPSGEDYRKVTRALFLDQDAYLKKEEERKGVKNLRLVFEGPDLRRDLEQLTGYAALVGDEFETDFVVTYKVGSTPLDFEQLKKSAVPNTLYDTLGKQGPPSQLFRTRLGVLNVMDAMSTSMSFDFKTFVMKKEDAVVYFKSIAKNKWAPRPVGNCYDFFNLLTKDDMSMTTADVPHGQIVVEFIDDDDAILYGNLTSKHLGVLSPVILGMVENPPRCGYQTFDYQ